MIRTAVVDIVAAVARTVAVLAGAAVSAQALIPAGSINAAVTVGPKLVVAQDGPALRYVTAVRDELFRGSAILTAVPEAEQAAGHTLVVYATPEHPWMGALRDALPFAYGEGTVTVDGRTLHGEHLRVIAALRNPFDRERRAVFYTAAHPADLVGINLVFHGPTEWVVADGRTVLASGSFLRGVTLSPAAMSADLERLAATLRAVHPATVDAMPAPLAAALAAAASRLSEPLERVAFARVLAGVLVALHDAHTALTLPRSGEALALPFVWIDDGMIVAADAGALRRGDRIVALGGLDAAEIERRLAAVVPAENPHWVRQRAPQLLVDLGCLRALGIEVVPPPAVRIERDGEEQDVAVGSGALPAGDAADWVRYTIDRERSLGVFVLDRCVVDEHYRVVLANFFAEAHAHGVRRIAVDLRANAGGNSTVTNEFLRYLAVDTFADFSGDVRWSADVFAQRGGTGEARLDRARPQRRDNAAIGSPPPYRGELTVAIGPGTFSSGNWFATVLRDNRLATLVGEPTGNAPSSYGDILSFTLPASGLSFTVSFKRWIRPDPTRDPAPSLAPDVVVPRTRATIRDGSDPVLDWLRAR